MQLKGGQGCGGTDREGRVLKKRFSGREGGVSREGVGKGHL
jgi:hypothetical protein